MSNIASVEELRAQFAAAREAVAARLAGLQLEIAGAYLQAELSAHGGVGAVPDQTAARLLGGAFGRNAESFPAKARAVAARADDPGFAADIEASADRIDGLNASPVLLANVGDLKMLGPDTGLGAVDTSAYEPPPPPPEPAPVEVTGAAVPFDQFSADIQQQAQAAWSSQVGPEAQSVIDAAMATISGGGGGISIGGLSGALTAAAVGAAAAVGGPLGVALGALAIDLIPRMLAEFEDWLVGYALEHGGI